jgi:hypothetical protein
MDALSIAPCGVICDICSAFQRDKNKKNYCVGCRRDGTKMGHCKNCLIKNCVEKSNTDALCIECEKYPCTRIKNLHKRYVTKYNENIYENMETVKNKGTEYFIKIMEEQWKCKKCGALLCAHKDKCTDCGLPFRQFPI